MIHVLTAPSLVGIGILGIVAWTGIDDSDDHSLARVIARVLSIQVIPVVVFKVHRLALYLITSATGTTRFVWPQCPVLKGVYPQLPLYS